MISLWGITGLFPGPSAWSQEIDYSQLWKDSWQKAETILQDNQLFMKREASRMDIPLEEAVAVIFPELVRYSAIRDAMEISLLKTLYVYKGDDYADFSVGIFQLKPSCAVQIRQKAISMKDTLVNQLFKPLTDYPDEKSFRSAVVNELEDPPSAFNYVLAFFRICEAEFGHRHWTDINEKIRFYATAYNSGFTNPESYIEEMMAKKFYYTSVLKKPPFYSYADISVCYFKNQTNKKY